MIKNKKLVLAILALVFIPGLSFAGESMNYQASFESGFVSVLNHRIQFSENNTYFDYVQDGAQDTLYSNQRWTAEVGTKENNLIRFVYQPLDIRTSAKLEEDLKVDNVTFDANTTMNFRYSFPYYRATYLWNLIQLESWQIYGGFGLQIRNAIISFESQDGSKSVSNRNVGPVPLFSLLADYSLTTSTNIVFEAEGNYANTAFINGDNDSAVTGAILDTALGIHTTVSKKMTVFSKLRYVSGGAEGTSDEKNSATGDGYNSNWIDLLAMTLGLTLHLEHW